jgi:hypothetical protein
MAKVFIEETTLTAIGDAIRGKTGKTDLIDPANMSTEIAGIEAGGGPEIPEEAFLITGDCAYKFANGGWDWFVRGYGPKITTRDITSTNCMFQKSGLTEIPFQINLNGVNNLTGMFQEASQLEVCPKLRGNIAWTTSSNLTYMLTGTQRLRDAEDFFEPEMLEGFSAIKVTSAYSVPRALSLSNMYSLRKVPSWWYKFRLNEESTTFPSYSYCAFQGAFSGCYVLDEIRDIPVWKCAGAQTSNMFSSIVSVCPRLKTFTFETNVDGSPIETKWKSQVLDFSDSNIGWTRFQHYIGYNSGIDAVTKRVYDDETYQALKNDPDWWASSVEYCRYNHDSAVETINSLPDTSAYLATAGGTNTIKFKGTAGSATDGGAINTLTEEEIAVATAKGWTVTLA